jgi:hypothetical protein
MLAASGAAAGGADGQAYAANANGGATALAAPTRWCIGMEWANTAQWSSTDIIATADGGFVVTGVDYALAKYDGGGNFKWGNDYNSPESGTFSGVVQAPDGGYFVAGHENSNKFVVARFDSKGHSKWFKTYSGNNEDWFNALTNTPDGGFVAVGGTKSASGVVPGNNGYTDCIAAKFDGNGDLVWMKNIGGTDDEEFYSVTQSGDGGFVAVGSSYSQDAGFKTTRGGTNCIIVKLGADGSTLWSRVLGSSGNDHFSSVALGADGGYVAMGFAENRDGDFPGGKYGNNYVLVKYNAAGNRVWTKRGDDASSMNLECLRKTPDGGYIATGTTSRRLAGRSEWEENYWYEVAVARFDSNGNRKWLKTYDVNNYGEYGGISVAPAASGGYVVLGENSVESGSELYPVRKDDGAPSGCHIVKLPETPAVVKAMPDRIYTGKLIAPDTVITIGSTRLVKDRDYTITYKHNKSIGTAEAKIVGKGNYYGTRTLAFNINPRTVALKKLKAGTRQLTVTWKKTASSQKIDYYQVRYKLTTAKKWKVRKLSPKTAKVTIKKLKKGKRYQVQVRCYKEKIDYEDDYVPVARYYGAWSKVRTSGKIR